MSDRPGGTISTPGGGTTSRDGGTVVSPTGGVVSEPESGPVSGGGGTVTHSGTFVPAGDDQLNRPLGGVVSYTSGGAVERAAVYGFGEGPFGQTVFGG